MHQQLLRGTPVVAESVCGCAGVHTHTFILISLTVSVCVCVWQLWSVAAAKAPATLSFGQVDTTIQLRAHRSPGESL